MKLKRITVCMHNTKTREVPPKTLSVVDKAPHSCDTLLHLAHQIHLKKEDGMSKIKDIFLLVRYTQGSCSSHITA